MTESMLEVAVQRIRKAWCAETSSEPSRWKPERPSIGQCAVTSCLIQDQFGMPVIRGKIIIPQDMEEISHYWNRGLDVTFDQFQHLIDSGREVRVITNPPSNGMTPYDYCMTNEAFVSRYQLLKERFKNQEIVA